jgi:adsorption protein B
VQIPIISLKRRWWNLIGGHYMDEFAEAHCKEIHGFAGIVPGADVGELATPCGRGIGC